MRLKRKSSCALLETAWLVTPSLFIVVAMSIVAKFEYYSFTSPFNKNLQPLQSNSNADVWCKCSCAGGFGPQTIVRKKEHSPSPESLVSCACAKVQ